MRRTSAEVSIRVVNEEAKQDATMAMPDLHPLTSLNEIKDDDYEGGEATTLELNFWGLGGDAEIYRPDMKMGAWTNSMTDEDGIFPDPPSLTATFPLPISTAGITLRFGGDNWPSEIRTTWYHGSTVLAVQTDVVDRYNYFVDHGVDEYDGWRVEFLSTALPYRRVRILEIDFGQILIWAGGEIVRATKLEEVNLTSTQLPLSTVDVTVHDTNEEFNMLNPQGIYRFLREKQRIFVDEVVNGVKVPIGRAYLETWDNESATIARFGAKCALWLFDGAQFAQAAMWSNTSAATVLSQIFAAAGWEDYVIHDGIGGQVLSGYVTGTVRQALQQTCFALRASCRQERDGFVHIRRLPSSVEDRPIEKSSKAADSQNIEQERLVNSVVVTAYTFTANASGSVEVGGVKYNVAETKYIKEAPNLTASTRAQEVVSGVYLISSANGQAVADWLHDDYQRRIKQSFKLIMEDEEPGDNVDVDTMMGQRQTGILTKMKIDLTGGFLADCEVRG